MPGRTELRQTWQKRNPAPPKQPGSGESFKRKKAGESAGAMRKPKSKIKAAGGEGENPEHPN